MGNPLKSRLIGLLALIGGGLIGWFSILKPLQDAENGAPSISTTMKGAVFAPILVMYGISALIFGDMFDAFLYTQNGDKKQLTPLGWVVTLIGVGIGIGVYFWMDSRFKALGYGG